MVSGVVNSNYNELLNEQLLFILYCSCCANVETVHCQGFRSAADAVGFPQFNRRTMIRRHATAADFNRWETAAAVMTDAELIHAAADCRKVESLWRGVDGMVEGFYSDQAATYGTELYRRRSIR